MLLVPQYVPKRTRAKFEIEIGMEKTRAMGSSRLLEVVTSSFRSQEGGRPSFVVLGEVHHWLSSNGGHDMYNVIERNLTKSAGGQARFLAITNAYEPGEDSIGERQRLAYDKLVSKGMVEEVGVLYDTLEAPPEAPLTLEAIPKVIEKIRGDAVWLDIPSITKSILDPMNPPSRSRRFYYNQVVSNEETLVPSNIWGAVRIEGAKLKPDDEIVLGFDGGRTDDSTVLMALRLSDRCLIPILIEEKPKASTAKWSVDMTAFDDAVAYAFEHYRVRAFFADVAGWESYIDKWSGEYRGTVLVKASPGKSAVGYDMRSHQEEITKNNERFVGSIVDGALHHNDDPIVREHVMNTRKRVNKFGMSFTKLHRETDRKNDAYAASLLAFIAMNKYLESDKRPKERTGNFWAF